MNAISRWTVRALLVLILLGVGYSAWRVTAQKNPQHWWRQAQAALAAGDRPAARLHLENLLVQMPDHVEGRFALARLELVLASTADRPATLATCPRALKHLAEAARLRPGDLALQRELLAVYAPARRMREARAVAERILAHDPDDVGALYCAAFGAVEAGQTAKAERRLADLRQAAARPVFQTLVLSAKWAQDTGNAAALQAALDELVATIDSRAAGDVIALPRDEQSALYELAVIAVDRAPSATIATRRAGTLLVALGRWSEAADEVLSETPTLSRGRLAELAEQIAAAVSTRFPVAAADAEGAALRAPLSRCLDRIRQLAIDAGQAGPACYRPLAAAAFAAGDFELGLQWVARGLAAADQLGPSAHTDAMQLRLLAAQWLVAAGRAADAGPYLQAILPDAALSGWGHLLLGNIALNENRAAAALDELRLAEKQLGHTLQVRAALARTHTLLGRWPEALVQLADLQAEYPQLSASDRQWLDEHLGPPARLSFERFRGHLALGQWQEAQPHLAAVEGDPLEARAYALAVGYLWNARQPQKAQSWLAQARRLFPRDLELAWLEATLCERQGRPEEASAVLAHFVAACGGDVPSQLLASRWRMEHGQAEAAADEMHRLAGRQDITPAEREVIALLESQALLAAGKIDEALTAVAPLRNHEQLATAASLVAAAAAARQENWAAVDAALAAAGQATNQHQAIGLFQGEIAAARGDYAAAIGALAPALDVAALRERAGAALCRALDEMAKDEGLAAAWAKAQALVEAYPRDATLLAIRADLEFRSGRLEAAWATLDALEQLDTASPAADYFRATAWYGLRQPARALEAAERALAKQPTHVPTLLLAAEVCLSQGDPRGALVNVGRAVKQNPQAWWGYLLQAEALGRLQRYDDAVRVLAALVQAQPRLTAARVALCGTLLAAGHGERALESIRAAREALPDEPALVAAHVGLLCRLDRLDEALAVASAAAAESTGAALPIAVAEALLGTGHAAAALTWTERAVHLADDEHGPAAHLVAGRACLALGLAGEAEQLAAAREHFAAVVAREPGNLLAANNLAWLLASQCEQPQRAVRVAEMARGAATVAQLPVEFVDTLAMAYRLAGRWPDAARLIDEAVAIHPTEPKLHWQLGQFFADRREPDKARQAIARALELGLGGSAAKRARQLLRELDGAVEAAGRAPAPTGLATNPN